jgi:hypothetical protein
MATAAQSPKAHPEDVGVQLLGPFVVTFDAANIGSATGVQFATLPAGSIVLRTTTVITTAFNAATTNVLTVGIPGTVDALMTTAVSIPGTIGVKVTNGPASTLTTPTAADVGVFARYTQSGTAATAGRAVIYVEFFPALDYAA